MTDSTELQTVLLEKTEARELTDQIKGRAEELWHMLLDAYERGAHTALGYSSWGSYFEAEFGGTKQHGHRLLDAGRVVRAIESESPIGDSKTPNESQARPLSTLAKSSPEEAAEVWGGIVEEHGDSLTAADVTEAVNRRAEEKRTFLELPPDFVEIMEDLEHAGCTRVINDDTERNRLYKIFAEDGIEAAKEIAEVIAGDDKPDIRSVDAARKYLKNKRRKEERDAENAQEVADVEESEAVEDPDAIKEIVRVGAMEYVVEFNDGRRHTVTRSVVLEKDFKKCSCCNGYGVVERHQDQS